MIAMSSICRYYISHPVRCHFIPGQTALFYFMDYPITLSNHMTLFVPVACSVDWKKPKKCFMTYFISPYILEQIRWLDMKLANRMWMYDNWLTQKPGQIRIQTNEVTFANGCVFKCNITQDGMPGELEKLDENHSLGSVFEHNKNVIRYTSTSW